MSRFFIVRYTVKHDQVATNERLARAVFDEIHEIRPAGIRYATYQLDDNATFVNLVATETPGGLAPLSHLQAYRQIQHGKHDRFEQEPIVTELHEIGSYRVFGD